MKKVIHIICRSPFLKINLTFFDEWKAFNFLQSYKGIHRKQLIILTKTL